MSSKDRRQREKRNRKNDILNAAEKIFIKNGYENATMDKVAAEVELSKGTLYLYYKSKEELYLGINIRAMRKMYELFSEAFDKGETGYDKIYLIGRAYVKFALEYPNYFDSLLHFESRTFEEIGGLPLAKEYIEITTMANILVTRAVADGMADGSIRPGLHPETTCMLSWALTSGFVKFIVRKEDVIGQHFVGGIDGIIEAFFDLMTNGLKA